MKGWKSTGIHIIPQCINCHSGHKTALLSYTSLKLDKSSWTHPTDSFRTLKSVGFIYSVVLYFLQHESIGQLHRFFQGWVRGIFWGWVLWVYLVTVILFLHNKKKEYKKLQGEWMKNNDDAVYWWYPNLQYTRGYVRVSVEASTQLKHLSSISVLQSTLFPKQLQLIKFYAIHAIQKAKEDVITASVMVNPI